MSDNNSETSTTTDELMIECIIETIEKFSIAARKASDEGDMNSAFSNIRCAMRYVHDLNQITNRVMPYSYTLTQDQDVA